MNLFWRETFQSKIFMKVWESKLLYLTKHAQHFNLRNRIKKTISSIMLKRDSRLCDLYLLKSQNKCFIDSTAICILGRKLITLSYNVSTIYLFSLEMFPLINLVYSVFSVFFLKT